MRQSKRENEADGARETKQERLKQPATLRHLSNVNQVPPGVKVHCPAKLAVW